MKNITVNDFSKLKKCFKITLKNGEILAFNNSSKNITIDQILYLSSGGFDDKDENFYSDLTSSETNIVGFIDNNNISIDEVLSGKFDNAVVEIFFINLENNERINITKGQIQSLELIDGKVSVRIGGILDILDKNIGETYSPMCRAKFCDNKCSLDINNFTFFGEIDKIKSNVEFTYKYTTIMEKNYFKYGILTFTSGENNGQSMEVKQSFDNTIILNAKFTYNLKIGDSFKITAGCDKSFNTCCNIFNNAVNFRGEPYIESTTKMYKFY